MRARGSALADGRRWVKGESLAGVCMHRAHVGLTAPRTPAPRQERSVSPHTSQQSRAEDPASGAWRRRILSAHPARGSPCSPHALLLQSHATPPRHRPWTAAGLAPACGLATCSAQVHGHKAGLILRPHASLRVRLAPFCAPAPANHTPPALLAQTSVPPCECGSSCFECSAPATRPPPGPTTLGAGCRRRARRRRRHGDSAPSAGRDGWPVQSELLGIRPTVRHATVQTT